MTILCFDAEAVAHRQARIAALAEVTGHDPAAELGKVTRLALSMPWTWQQCCDRVEAHLAACPELPML